MSIKARLNRLERPRGGPASCGITCPPVQCVYECDGYGQGSEPPAPGRRCGRPPIVIRIVYDADFFANIDRFEEVKG